MGPRVPLLLRFKKKRSGRPLSNNTKAIYFSKLKACLRQAAREGLIDSTVADSAGGYSLREGHRMYLTATEIKKLAATRCPDDRVRRAFLFSCLTGLRFCDIARLRWRDVYKQGNFTRIIFSQQKTGGCEYLDINYQAAELMGRRGAADDLVFEGLKYPTLVNAAIARWVRAAGIEKHISFHSARHSFAVMMLDLGADIYTCSKLLGHKNIATTQIYAHILDKNKQKAIEMIPKLI